MTPKDFDKYDLIRSLLEHMNGREELNKVLTSNNQQMFSAGLHGISQFYRLGLTDDFFDPDNAILIAKDLSLIFLMLALKMEAE